MKKFFGIILFASLAVFLFAKEPTEVIKNYRKSKLVFLGKIIGIQELEKEYDSESGLFQQPVMIEFEVYRIYKGKRYEKLMIADTIDVHVKDYYIINREYIVYLKKNRKNKKQSRYSILRSRRFGDKETQEENIELVQYIKKKWFRWTKNPTPYIRFISGACNC